MGAEAVNLCACNDDDTNKISSKSQLIKESQMKAGTNKIKFVARDRGSSH